MGAAFSFFKKLLKEDIQNVQIRTATRGMVTDQLG